MRLFNEDLEVTLKRPSAKALDTAPSCNGDLVSSPLVEHAGGHLPRAQPEGIGRGQSWGAGSTESHGRLGPGGICAVYMMGIWWINKLRFPGLPISKHAEIHTRSETLKK